MTPSPGGRSSGWTAALTLTIKVPFRLTAPRHSTTGGQRHMQDTATCRIKDCLILRRRGTKSPLFLRWCMEALHSQTTHSTGLSVTCCTTGPRTTGTRFHEPLLVKEKGVKELPSLMSHSIQQSASSSAPLIELTIKFNLILCLGLRGSPLILGHISGRSRHIFFLSHTHSL